MLLKLDLFRKFCFIVTMLDNVSLLWLLYTRLQLDEIIIVCMLLMLSRVINGMPVFMMMLSSSPYHFPVMLFHFNLMTVSHLFVFILLVFYVILNRLLFRLF